MGIPSYFAYIIKRHRKIVRPFRKSPVDTLYLDSNSVIYDTLHRMEDVTVPALIRAVCDQILVYVNMVGAKNVFVAFDGVPPKAKMKQQRERRYKSVPGKWNTAQITPGTAFMAALDHGVKQFFAPYKTITVSGSDEPGEGEQKIFTHLRANPGKNTMVYGLDADLIVLALSHSHLSTIHLLREAPAFMVRDDKLQVLDIRSLATEIEALIGKGRIMDYIVLTLFLGNDFMPKFPALNLRTVGHDILISTYIQCVGEDRLFVSEMNYAALGRFVAALARREHADLKAEHNRPRKVEQTEETMPSFHREVEHYINPNEMDWEYRYYTALFDSARSPLLLHKACEAYYAMLNWNMRYYTGECVDWGISYPFLYPPLLADLARHKLSEPVYTQGRPVDAVDLLKYVLPAKYSEFSVVPYASVERHPTMVWAYCRFTWEAHLRFPSEE